MAAPKQTDPQFKLRLTPDLKQDIETAADANGRSMNAEIVARLEQSFLWPVLSSGMRAVIEQAADLNGQSFNDEVWARLNFTLSYDREFFDPKVELVVPKGTLEERISGIENQLAEVITVLHELSGTIPEIDRPMDENAPTEGESD